LSILFVSLLFGVVAGLLAHHKARNALGWFVAGSVIGPFALLVVLLPMAVKPGVTRRCPQCSETVRSEARICRFCQSELEGISVA